MPALWIVAAAILGVLAWIFGKKISQERAVNRAKVPEAVLQWETEVIAAAKEFDVPSTIAMAVLWTESVGNKNARGSSGEYGLMQLKEIAIRDLQLNGFGTFDGWRTDAAQNIRAGVAYLKLQYRRTGDWFKAVKAYNQGYQGAKDNPQLAQNYLDKVRNKEQFFGYNFSVNRFLKWKM